MLNQILYMMENPLVMIAILAWSLSWKGVALWRSARNNQKNWFVALLVVNTVGLLEIFYIFLWDKVLDFFKHVWGKSGIAFKKQK